MCHVATAKPVRFNDASHLAAITGDTILVPYHVVKSLQLIWDWAPVDEIYGCPIFKWVSVTWLLRQDPMTKVSVMTTKVTYPVIDIYG